MVSHKHPIHHAFGTDIFVRREMRRGHPPLRGDGRGVMLLLMLLRNVADLDRKPPLTLGLMGLMGGLHFQKMLSPSQFKRYSLCPDKVLAHGELSRVLASAFLHVDDIHLYHNMISFLWKGYHLEHRFGALRFGLTIAYLLVLCHTLVVVGAFALENVVGLHGVMRQCSIGFSGVLFALKVVLNHGSPAFSNVYGFQVPTKYAAWLELVLIHVLVPRTSFIGHVCGILAGYVYVLTRSDKTWIDPCATWLEKLWLSMAAQPPREHRDFGSGTAASPRGTPSRRPESDEELARRLQDEENRRATSGVRERFEAYERSMADQPIPPAPRTDLTPDELRRRRMARFRNT